MDKIYEISTGRKPFLFVETIDKKLHRHDSNVEGPMSSHLSSGPHAGKKHKIVIDTILRVILSTQYASHTAQCSVLSTEYSVLSTQCSVLETEH